MHAIEYIEPRLLLAFSSLQPGGQLLITGSSGDDSVTVVWDEVANQINATLNGVTESTLRSGVGLVMVEAGAGNDFVSIQMQISSLVNGGEGDDSILGAAGRDTFNGQSGNDTLDGGSLGDRLSGGSRGVADPNDGNDQLYGRGGDDQLYADGGNDLFDGGSGSRDNVSFESATDDLTLSLDGVANDGIVGQAASNLQFIEDLSGGRGTDLIVGNGSGNWLVPGPRVGIDAGGDTVIGNGGDDTLDATASDGLFDSGSGDDILINRGGNDNTLRGQGGDDNLIYVRDPAQGAAPTGEVSGGSGADDILFGQPNDGPPNASYEVSFDDIANDGANGVLGTANFRSDIEEIMCGQNGDILSAAGRPNGTFIDGGLGDDTTTGGAFSDTLDGGDGDDIVSGGIGEDVVRGGAGNDELTGGAGPDSFNGGRGNDIMNAADGEADVVNGAQGLRDSADIDDLLDTLIRVESTT